MSVRLILVENHAATMSRLASEFKVIPDFEIVGTATNSQDALDAVSTKAADVVIVDVHTPGGVQPRCMMRSLSERCNVVVYTAEERPAYRRAVLESGAQAYILKSQSIPELIEAIRKVHAGERNKQPIAGQPKLSPTDLSILYLLARGCKYAEIADLRHTSTSTVRHQCERLQIKIGVSSREELICWAVKNGFGDVI